MRGGEGDGQDEAKRRELQQLLEGEGYSATKPPVVLRAWSASEWVEAHFCRQTSQAAA
jgi:hypothetical protein